MNTLKKRCQKRQVMAAHMELVRTGEFLQARRVLDLLRNGAITCGLSNVGWSVSCLLETIGVRNWTSRTGNIQHFQL